MIMVIRSGRGPTPSLLVVRLLSCALLSTTVLAGNGPLGSNCSVSNNRLDHNTHAFIDDCDARGYCAGTNVCLPKQCRSDEFPFGFAPGDMLPPMCGTGQYCPDEESGCLPLVPLGGICQLNRDDQCQPPPPLASPSMSPTYRVGSHAAEVGFNATMPTRPLNSICLRGFCVAANITLNQPCQTDETVYVGYTPANVAFTNVVSRDNCIGPALYCDATTSVCLQAKEDGERCAADKECVSYNCHAQTICVAPPEAPVKIGAWGYAVVALVIAITIVLLIICLWKVHKSGSAKKRAELDEYYKEQLAYRTSILSLQSAVAALPPPISHHHLSKQPPPHRPASRSRSHYSMDNPYDSGRHDYDDKYDDRRSSKEYEEKKFGSHGGGYGGGYEPEPLAYGYSESKDARGGAGGETYEDWEEVDLRQHGRQ